jgi:hypothetical protein
LRLDDIRAAPAGAGTPTEASAHVHRRHEHLERIISQPGQQPDQDRISHGGDQLPSLVRGERRRACHPVWANEGRCVHEAVIDVPDPQGKQVWGEVTPNYCEPIELVLHVTTDLAGREVESADVLINGQESNLAQLAILANAIVDLGEMYRATPGRSDGP